MLNRCRQHEKAEKELETAIKDEENADNIMILYAYLISNCVHNNDTQKAKQLFNSISKPLRKSVRICICFREISQQFVYHKWQYNFQKKQQNYLIGITIYLVNLLQNAINIDFYVNKVNTKKH